jgi:LysM repeat protein
MKLKLLLALALLVGGMLSMAFAAPAQAAASTICTQYHTVQRGENLYRISLRYGVSMSAIQSWNHIANVNRIFAGQRLCVQMTATPRTYVVQRGDWLMRIARRFGVDPGVLARVNNISNPNRIFPGQVLIIPDFTIQ